MPMLTLTALEEGSGLRIRTEVVEVPVWSLPLPGGERLELVVVPEGPAQLGSPPTEHDRQVVMDFYAAHLDGCLAVGLLGCRGGRCRRLDSVLLRPLGLSHPHVGSGKMPP